MASRQHPKLADLPSRRGASNALRTIETDTAAATGRMRPLLLNAWLRPLAVGLILWLGICGESWATLHWLSTRVESRIQTVAPLDLDIEEACETLAQLEAATWGIALRKIDGERSVVLPAGALADPPWTVDARPAVKLSNEWSSSMAALEQQLMKAFQSLSTQPRTWRA